MAQTMQLVAPDTLTSLTNWKTSPEGDARVVRLNGCEFIIYEMFYN